jgi:FlaA1/EpsC-like NDP-sugar epimerase
MKRLRNRYFAIGDVVLLAAAVYISYVLRLERVDLGEFWLGFFLFTFIAVVVTPLLFSRTGIYARYWQYATAEDVLLLLGVTAISVGVTTALSMFGDKVVLGTTVIPRSIPLIFLLLAVAVTTGQRLGLLLIARYTHQPRTRVHMLRRRLIPNRTGPLVAGGVPAAPVLVMGAGAAGSMIVRELQNNPQLGMHVVGFLDDDIMKQKLYIHGTPVLGTRHDLQRIVNEYNAQTVIIAMPTASGKTIREIVQACEEIDVKTKIIPGIYELLGGHVSVSQLRNVQVDDLLRREPVRTDTSAVRHMIEGQTVLVTGAGGSIGSELCRQVLHLRPSKLVLLGHGENSIFEIDNELRRIADRLEKQNSISVRTDIVPVIADIRHKDRIDHVMSQHRPDLVFHAAAHKHVPLMEVNPSEAVANNVLGTRIVLDAAVACGVKRFVLISTDKAVNPTSVMGATKRIAELLVHKAALETRRPYVAVRFGNVLGSRGSVVLTFREQIAAGGPVTVTHPEMLRFFMTIPEAVQLVLQAAALGHGGEVFMLDMGEPVRIMDLARDLIELSGFVPGHDIDIVFTGIRPGEKLFEELFVKGEKYERTKHEKVFIAANATAFMSQHLSSQVGRLEALAEANQGTAVVSELKRILPHYEPQRAAVDAPSDRTDAAGSGNGKRIAPQEPRVSSDVPPVSNPQGALAVVHPEDPRY